jgi:hypothetical protein
VKSFQDSQLGRFPNAARSGSWQMLGVSHFSEAFLKAAEDELTVSVGLTPLEIGLIFSPIS